MLAILDYDAGNLTSVRLACERAGAAPVVTDDPAIVARARRVVFPGVGAAASGMAGLAARGLDRALRDAVEAGRPVLAICLGMQLLFAHSDEDGGAPGLGLLAGRVVRFDFGGRGLDDRGARIKVPHMGWNPVGFPRPHPLLAGIPDGSAFYFVHSYHVVPGWADPALDGGEGANEAANRVADGAMAPGAEARARAGRVWGVTEYAGVRFASMAGRGNLFAVQGHPERSGEAGAALLANFLAWDGTDGGAPCS